MPSIMQFVFVRMTPINLSAFEVMSKECNLGPVFSILGLKIFLSRHPTGITYALSNCMFN